MYFDPAHYQQLRQLHQQLVAQRDCIMSLPDPPLVALEVMLETDARLLLLTPKFRQFVRLLLAEMAANPAKFPHAPHASADPFAWILPSLPMPLRIRRLPDLDAPNAIGMWVELGEWLQVFVLSASEQPDADQTRMPAWETISAQLQQEMSQLPVAPALQFFLTQELMCLLGYLGEFAFDPTISLEGLESL